MSSFTTLVTYRDHTDAQSIIPIDSEDVVIGLQAFGVKPVQAKTDGRKLILTFVKEEVLDPFQRIQSAMAGALPAPLMVDYNQILLARQLWKGLLTMMRTVSISKP